MKHGLPKLNFPKIHQYNVLSPPPECLDLDWIKCALAESRNLSKYHKTIAILLQVHQLIHSSPHVGLVSFIFTVCKTKTFLSALLSLYFLCSCWVLSEGHIPASYVSVKVVQSISFKEDQSISVKGVQSFSVKGVQSISFKGIQRISSNIARDTKELRMRVNFFLSNDIDCVANLWYWGWSTLTGFPKKYLLEIKKSSEDPFPKVFSRLLPFLGLFFCSLT